MLLSSGLFDNFRCHMAVVYNQLMLEFVSEMGHSV